MNRSALALCLVLVGCAQAPAPQRGGGASAALTGFAAASAEGGAAGSRAEVSQGDNAAAASSQTVERTETRQTVAVAPVPVMRVTETPTEAGPVIVTEHFAPPAVLTSTVAEKTSTNLGPAQKDSSQEIMASLSAMRPMQYVGIGFLGLALACFHPIARKTLGAGKTLPTAAAGVGVLLIFGPQLFAGHETLALCLAVGALIVVYLTSRGSYHEGRADSNSAASRG